MNKLILLTACFAGLLISCTYGDVTPLSFPATSVKTFSFLNFKVNGTDNWTNARYYGEEAKASDSCDYYDGFQLSFDTKFPVNETRANFTTMELCFHVKSAQYNAVDKEYYVTNMTLGNATNWPEK